MKSPIGMLYGTSNYDVNSLSVSGSPTDSFNDGELDVDPAFSSAGCRMTFQYFLSGISTDNFAMAMVLGVIV